MGADIFVLDTGAVIDAEAEAMLQALHSRSLGGLLEHLVTLMKKGAKGFIKIFYVGYGHKSIGDCGSLTVFIENVSMLVTKAVQDFMLYSGQEGSSRFIDFAKQPFINSFGLQSHVLERYREFYVQGLPRMIEHFKKRHPYQSEWDKSDYEKTIKARAFDVMRGFLPAGATTKLAWHGDLRHIADHLMLLRHHPLTEVREVASAIEDALKEKYPSSFGHKRYEETESFNHAWMKDHGYNRLQILGGDEPLETNELLCRSNIDIANLKQFSQVLRTRPPKTEIPKKVGIAGTMCFGFLLDFGSFRDIQRQRAVVQMMPLLSMGYGFCQWYLDEMPTDLAKEARLLLEEQAKVVKGLGLTHIEAQYYCPMGYLIPNFLTGDLPALVYLVELRATRFVHPTLRKVAINMAKMLREQFGRFGLVIHLDPQPESFDVKRGKQDIVLKK